MISVIIPVFNSEKTIVSCLSSLLSQKIRDDFEIIAVNDASTDSTEKKITEFENKVVYVKNAENKGPAFSRNLGAKNARGELLCFIDADCVAGKNWLFEMTAPFEDKNVAAVQGAYKTRQKELIARFAQEEIEQRYDKIRKAKKLDWVGSYSAAYRKKIFDQENGFDESFPIASGEDPDLSFRVAKKGFLIVFNEKAIVFHSHPNTLSKYLETKFWRAYYRVLLYKKHPDKAFSDSYTPQLLKLRVAGFFIGAFSIMYLWLNKNPLFFNAVIFLLLFYFILSPLPFVLRAAKKNLKVALVSPLILLGRDSFFALGLFLGTLKSVVK